MNAEADVVKAAGAGRPRELRDTSLQPMRTDWPTAVCRRLKRSGVVGRVVVAEVLGSAPREAGACMLIDANGTEGTIGGGNLEWRALELARTMLGANSAQGRACVATNDAPASTRLTSSVAQPVASLESLTLGRELGQCCGGVVQVFVERFTRADLPLLRRASGAAREGSAWMTTQWTAPAGAAAPTGSATRSMTARSLARNRPLFGIVTRSLTRSGDGPARVQLLSSRDESITLIERIDLARMPVSLYGAGHVGQALVRVLADLPFEVTWIDSRAELFPRPLPDNVRVTTAPLDAARAAPPNARHIVMTHDHALDYALCRAILERNELAWLGLIGSESKAARFRSRLKRDGVLPERIARLVCPIGLPDIASKLPAAIAIGIAVQLLREAGEASPTRLADIPIRSDAQHTDDCDAEHCASCHRASQ